VATEKIGALVLELKAPILFFAIKNSHSDHKNGALIDVLSEDLRRRFGGSFFVFMKGVGDNKCLLVEV